MDAHSQQSASQYTPYLSRNQQDLLVAALNSQSGSTQQSTSCGAPMIKRSASDPDNNQLTMDANGNQLFVSPQDAGLDNFDYTPELDYLDGDSGFDFENADLGGEMIGALPGDGHEKRKSRDDYDDEKGDAKRQETQEGEKSGAKKPGRKPLTSEPTTKRKAQNRAAQRAFRERKEQHLKDLETKVTELSKAQEADKHENGLLKAQVERLTTELREYRKRLSLTNGVGRSPPLSATNAQQRTNSGSSYGGNFQFDFPKFGALPGSQMFGSNGLSPVNKQDSISPPALQPQSRTTNSLSPKENSIITPVTNSPSQYVSNDMPFAPYSTNNNMHGFASTLPQMTGGSDPFGDLFSPSILKNANNQDYFKNNSSNATQPPVPNYSVDNGGDSTAGLNRVFQFNGGSNASDSTSPSASSQSQWNVNGTGNSSCGTSPEPTHDSPANKDKQADSFSQNVNAGNFNNNSLQSGMNSVDYNVPSLGSFDPVLFGDYRESNNAIVGGGDFTGGFFDDALNSAPFDFASPSNLFGILQSPQQSNASPNYNNSSNNHSQRTPKEAAPSAALMAEIEKARDGGDDDYGLPAQPSTASNGSGQLISCNNIWTQLQSNPDFQSGKFDLEGLCSELRTKAKCSETGVMVDKDHVEKALRKLGSKDESGQTWQPPEGLLFENDSWNKVLKQYGNQNQQV